MKKKQVISLAFSALLALPAHAQTSGGDLFKQANSLLKTGNCSDARAARTLYQKAKKVDYNLQADCDKRILKCNAIIKKECPVPLELSQEVVEIPYQGGESQIGVISSQSWNIEGLKEWMKTRSDNKNSFVLSCLEPNNTTRERSTTLTVKSGSVFKSLKVIQAARGEYLEADAKSLNFPATGTTEQIGVESNANWKVKSAPSWCRVEKSDTTIRIIVQPNDRVMERVADIIIESPNNEVTIKIYQGAGEEHLALSQNNLWIPKEGGKHYVKVYTDADVWYVGNFPDWLNVEKVGTDSICIETKEYACDDETTPNRSGSVQVRTDKQTVGLMVEQPPLLVIHEVVEWWKKKRIPGRDFSIGVSASYYMPFVSTSAGGGYIGSVHDYGLGTSQENASYKSAVGYSFGLFADMRLGHNVYLIAGANITQIKYKNTFDLITILTVPYNSYQYLKGEVQNSYTEEYTHTMIEVPILASYRFKLRKFSHVQLNLGPVLNFGLSSKMNFSGNSDSQTMHMFNRFTNTQVGNSNSPHQTSVGSEFNLYQPCVAWTESYTTGNIGDISHHDTFTESPLHRFNWGLRAGAAYEIAGLSFGLYYTMMLSNMANDGYWSNKRWTVLNESNAVMDGYKHRIHTLEFKLAYTLRYGKDKNRQ